MAQLCADDHSNASVIFAYYFSSSLSQPKENLGMRANAKLTRI